MSKSIRLRWKLAGLLGVVLAASVGAISYGSWRLVYEATAWLELRPSKDVSAEERSRFELTQRELLRSPPVLSGALAKPEISKLPIFEGVTDPNTWLRGKLIVTLLPGSNLITVSIRDSHQDSLAPLVNGICDAYLASLNVDKARRSDVLIQSLEQERNRRQAAIAKEMILDNIEREKAVLAKINERIDKIKAEAREQSQVHWIQQATVPLESTNRSRLAVALPAAGIAFFVPFAPLLLWEVFLRAAAELVEFVTRRKRETIVLGKDT